MVTLLMQIAHDASPYPGGCHHHCAGGNSCHHQDIECDTHLNTWVAMVVFMGWVQ